MSNIELLQELGRKFSHLNGIDVLAYLTSLDTDFRRGFGTTFAFFHG